FASRRRHTRLVSDWSSDVCSSDLETFAMGNYAASNDQLQRGYRDADAIHLTDFAARALALRSSSLTFAGDYSGAETVARFALDQIGRASCRERGESWEVARAVQES